MAVLNDGRKVSKETELALLIAFAGGCDTVMINGISFFCKCNLDKEKSYSGINSNDLTPGIYNLHELLASEIDEQIKELFGE